MFQRQLSKEGLQQVVNSNAGGAEGDPAAGGLSAAAMSSDELRDLFTLRTLTMSDTYDSMCAGDSSDVDVDVDGAEDESRPQDVVCKEQACAPTWAGISVEIAGEANFKMKNICAAFARKQD